MGNFDDITKTQESIINNSYFQQIKKDNAKKIKCKEKNFITFINSFNDNKVPLYSNYHYSKTVKHKNNISFQNTPIPPEKITYRNVYNNRDLINEINIKKDLYINTEHSTEERIKNKEKKFLNVKDKSKTNYQSFNNLKNFLRNDEFNNNNFHLIKSEKKIINLKQIYNINKTDLKTTKIPEKSKKMFNVLNTDENNENLSKEKIENKLNTESFLSKTENNFFNSNNNAKNVKYQGRNIKSLINNRIKNSKMNIDFSNKSTKIKNIFVKHKTQNKFGIINLKFENINKKKEDYLYIKSNNKIIKNNNKITNKEDTENNNIINYINYSSNTDKSNKNYKISSQNKKQNLIINKIPQKKVYNLSPSGSLLYNTDSNQDKKIMSKNNNIKMCNNQIIYNDNKNIFIQNNYINGKLHNSKEITQTNNQKQIYIKNKSFDNTKQIKQNNYITNLKNWIPISEHFNNAINNIKNIFLGNNEEKKEEENKIDTKDNNIKINNNIDNSNNNEDKSSIIDDSVILNSSDVYGTLNFSKSFNNNNNSEKKTNEEKENQGPKDNNKNKNNSKKENDKNKNDDLIINSYSNYRETITMNININQKANNNNNNTSKKEKEHKKIMLSEIIASNNNNNKDKTPKKEKVNINIISNKNPKNNNKNNIIPINNNTNNNICNFKTFSVLSLAGKNFGVRKTNQDTPVASININDVKGFNLFGVLDGHGSNGHFVSQYLRNYLVEKISKNKEISESKDLNKIYEIIKKSNYALLINIFLKADEALYKQNFDVTFSGTTCVLVIQIGKKIICANVGDSRAILVYKNNTNNNPKTSIFKLSHDFKPDLPEEKKRIYKMGGVVEQMIDINGMKAGPPRVWGVGKNYPGLAMSRSLGDFKGKKYGIISLPEIIEVNLDQNVNYIVICSDGVWEFLSNENVMDIGNEFYEKNDVHGFTKKLGETSEKMWEQKDVIVDDITAVAVFY